MFYVDSRRRLDYAVESDLGDFGRVGGRVVGLG